MYLADTLALIRLSFVHFLVFPLIKWHFPLARVTHRRSTE